MFTHRLTFTNKKYKVEILPYAKMHFIKRFQKDYKGKSWALTEKSIVDDLSRIGDESNKLQFAQQIDELGYKENEWIFKYDFRVFGTRVSTKASGNRVVGVLNFAESVVKILLVYGKGDLPKDKGEAAYIKETIVRELR